MRNFCLLDFFRKLLTRLLQFAKFNVLNAQVVVSNLDALFSIVYAKVAGVDLSPYLSDSHKDGSHGVFNVEFAVEFQQVGVYRD